MRSFPSAFDISAPDISAPSRPSIVCAVRLSGETGVIARLLTAESGLVAGYVAGGRGRHLRPVLIPGNLVASELIIRTQTRLPGLRVELVESRGPWLTEPLAAAAIGWVTALAATALPEREPCPRVYLGMTALLDAICHAPSARGWLRALVLFEAQLLRQLGYGNAASVPDDHEAWQDLLARFDRLEGRIARYLLADWRRDVIAARQSLRERLRRIDT